MNIPQPLPKTPLGKWADVVTKELRSSQLGVVGGSLISKIGAGSVVSDKLLTKKQILARTLLSAYNPNEAYTTLDEVIVPVPIKIDETHWVPAGHWMCRKAVPSNLFKDEANANALGEEYYRDPTKYYYPFYSKDWPNNYPVNPEVYWLPLFFYPTAMNICIDGVAQEYLVSAFPTSTTAPADAITIPEYLVFMGL